MGKEHDRLPKLSLKQIRIEAHGWLDSRQLMGHTTESLLAIAANEFTELEEAQKLGNPEHIDTELCDIVFAVMCVDPRETRVQHKEIEQHSGALEKFIEAAKGFLGSKENQVLTGKSLEQIDLIYACAKDYFSNRPQTLEKAMTRTIRKNVINYAFMMFEGPSPFKNPDYSREVLRIMRTTIGTTGMDKLWMEIRERFKLEPFWDAYAITGIFRSFLLDKLKEITKNEQLDGNLRTNLKRLIKRGKWTMEPLFVKGSKITWS